MKISDTSAQDIVLEPKSNTKLYAGIALLLLVLGTVAWFAAPQISRWSQAQESVSAERLRFAEVTRGDFVRDISVQGRVVAAVSPTLYATQSGTITFEVESGDSVHSGQILAAIDSPELQNQLLQEQARLSSLNVELQRRVLSVVSKNCKIRKTRIPPPSLLEPRNEKCRARNKHLSKAL